MKFAGPFTRRDAWQRAQATCMARARQRGVAYPIPHGDVVGIPPADLETNPIYGTHYLTAPLKGRVAGEFFLEVTTEMEALPGGTEKVDGLDIEVTRVGTERSRDIFPADESDLAER